MAAQFLPSKVISLICGTQVFRQGVDTIYVKRLLFIEKLA
jgi:hypothetical protein